MLREFKLGVIVKRGCHYRVLHVVLHQGLQHQLTEEWGEQFREFVEGIVELPFDPGYNGEEHERFVLDDYELPEGVRGITCRNADQLDPLSQHEAEIDQIKGIVAFALDEQRQQVVLFQNFTRSRVIRPGGFLFLDNLTYRTGDRPGLTLDKKLAAVFCPAERKLLFASFRTANTFLPLSGFYREASEQDIREMLGHESLAPEDVNVVVQEATQWSRKRFAMLRDSGVLDRYTVEEIAEHAEGYGVGIEVDAAGRIVFPTDRAGTKRLLQFLNEELFRGAITERLYETNSKREAD